MKNFLLLFASAILLSCSGSDDNSTTSNTSFHPPTWVQGTWGIKSEIGVIPSYRFSTNDVCQIAPTIADFCLQGYVNTSNSHNTPVTVDEQITDSKYYVTLTFKAGTIYHYNFEKVSATEIKWVNGAGTPKLIKM